MPPTITPGAGFSGSTGATQVGDEANRYYDQPVIARWIDVPYQDIVGATATIGLLADHGSGIASVQFILDGGTPVTVTTRETMDGVVSVTAYFVTIDATAMADSELRELRAIITPNHGTQRVLQGPTFSAAGADEVAEGVHSMWFATNGGGTLWSGSKYVNNVTGNDTTGDGSSGNPYATMMKALRELKVAKNAAGKGNNASGGIIFLQGTSDYTVGTYAFPEVETPNRWVTIAPAPGATPVIADSASSSGLRTQKLRLSSLSIIPSSTTEPLRSGNSPLNELAHLWLDNCTLDWVDPLTAGSAWFNGFRSVWVTGCTIQNTNSGVVNPFVKLVRDTAVSNLIGDAFSDVGCVCNCMVDDIYVSGSTHPDVYQLQQTDNANKYLYKIVASSEIDAQGIFQGGGWTVNGIVIDSCNIQRLDGSSWLNFSFAGTVNDLIIRNTQGSDNATTATGTFTRALVEGSTNVEAGTFLFLAGESGTLPFISAKDIEYRETPVAGGPGTKTDFTLRTSLLGPSLANQSFGTLYRGWTFANRWPTVSFINQTVDTQLPLSPYQTAEDASPGTMDLESVTEDEEDSIVLSTQIIHGLLGRSKNKKK